MSAPEGIHPIVMPKWGLSMQEGNITHWYVSEGQRIEQGQPLCDIETNKITNEFDAPVSGTVARICVPDSNEIVNVGQLIAVVTDEEVPPEAIQAVVDAHVMSGAEEAEAVAGPAVQTLDVGGHRIAYLEAGQPDSPRAVMFLHGFGGDHENWGLVQGRIAERQRTISVDLPGHGGSDRDVGDGSPSVLAAPVAELVRSLGLENVHLVAHSFGGAIALELAELLEGIVGKLTLISPVGLADVQPKEYVLGFVEAQRKRDIRPVLEMLFADSEHLSREMVNESLQLLRDDDAREALRTISDWLTRAAPSSRSLPSGVDTLVIWGDQDRVLPLSDDVRTRLEDRLVVLPGAGHMPHVEAHEQVVEIIGARRL